MIATILIGGFLGGVILGLIEEINGECNIANSTYNDILAQARRINRNSSKNEIKRLHDKLFETWLELKTSLNRLEKKKRKLSNILKNKKSYENKRDITKTIDTMKQQSIEIRKMKKNAHNEWQRVRNLLIY